jgi:hypothetical protein
VKQLSANVVTINTTMQSSMGEIKQDLTTQLESVFSALYTKLHILQITLAEPSLST